ncbi:unnamed protein product [Trichogramma brassicae]|uniref:Uncharacterized protein n=1 Tax=Trichogramma brassicae TaxID=86971 RepID=A0A6H5IZ01_9HYME|nr:unnamed protein product [Trichogramma brassicae]
MLREHRVKFLLFNATNKNKRSYFNRDGTEFNFNYLCPFIFMTPESFVRYYKPLIIVLRSRYLGRIIIYLPAISYFYKVCSNKILQYVETFKKQERKNLKRFGRIIMFTIKAPPREVAVGEQWGAMGSSVYSNTIYVLMDKNRDPIILPSAIKQTQRRFPQ